jgi:hypothetical protein
MDPLAQWQKGGCLRQMHKSYGQGQLISAGCSIIVVYHLGVMAAPVRFPDSPKKTKPRGFIKRFFLENYPSGYPQIQAMA